MKTMSDGEAIEKLEAVHEGLKLLDSQISEQYGERHPLRRLITLVGTALEVIVMNLGD